MTSNNSAGKVFTPVQPALTQEAPGQDAPGQDRRGKPEWADGLRQLYDSVLLEPLPDSFTTLLDRLDHNGQ